MFESESKIQEEAINHVIQSLKDAHKACVNNKDFKLADKLAGMIQALGESPPMEDFLTEEELYILKHLGVDRATNVLRHRTGMDLKEAAHTIARYVDARGMTRTDHEFGEVTYE